MNEKRDSRGIDRGGKAARPPSRVKCPQCGRRTAYQGNPWRPFCSERCQILDRAAWAEDKYAILTEDSAPEEPEKE